MSSQLALSAAITLSFLVSLAGEVALLVVVATVVRRHRPDAWGGLLAWAIAALVASVANRIVSTIATAVAAGNGVDAIIAMQTVFIVVGAAINIGLVVLLARGLVKLAQPPKPTIVPHDGAYR